MKKKLNKLTALMMALMMLLSFLPNVAHAEELTVSTYAEANEVFTDAVKTLIPMFSDENDEEVTKVLCGCAVYLLEMRMGFMTVADDGGDKDWFTETASTAVSYSAEPEYVSSFDYIAGYDIYQEEGYLCLSSEAFDARTNEQLDFLRIDIAQREDGQETMLLLTRLEIDGLLTSSNRYLIYKSGDSVQLLYSRTFGQDLEYCIDLQDWAQGTDYTWSKELLYPRH